MLCFETTSKFQLENIRSKLKKKQRETALTYVNILALSLRKFCRCLSWLFFLCLKNKTFTEWPGFVLDAGHSPTARRRSLKPCSFPLALWLAEFKQSWPVSSVVYLEWELTSKMYEIAKMAEIEEDVNPSPLRGQRSQRNTYIV